MKVIFVIVSNGVNKSVDKSIHFKQFCNWTDISGISNSPASDLSNVRHCPNCYFLHFRSSVRMTRKKINKNNKICSLHFSLGANQQPNGQLQNQCQLTQRISIRDGFQLFVVKGRQWWWWWWNTDGMMVGVTNSRKYFENNNNNNNNNNNLWLCRPKVPEFGFKYPGLYNIMRNSSQTPLDFLW